MGVITKYKLAFPEIDLAVSNHLSIIPSSGLTEFVLDADIKADMTTGSGGSLFEIKLFDLPGESLRELDEARRDNKTLEVKVSLGYLDGKVEQVLTGQITSVKAKVDGGKLVAELKGLETATWAAQNTRIDHPLPAAESDLEAAIRAALSEAKFERGSIDDTPHLQHLPAEEVRNARLQGKLVTVLSRLARQAEANFLLIDGQLYVGRPIAHTDQPLSPVLEIDKNLIGYQPYKKSLPGDIEPFKLVPLEPDEAHGFRFSVLGDPKLRPGQQLEIEGIDDFSAADGETFRISAVQHSFTLAGGYVCTGIAVKSCPPGDAGCRRQLAAGQAPSAEAIAGHLSERLEGLPRKRPFVEVGAVKEYEPGSAGESAHASTLYYNQRARASETQPSIRVPVETDDDKVFTTKPMVSPFAWRKCGLVVPVYPGMKALLQHNQGLADDVLVGGFFWSEDPDFEPPANQPGDWWLCLPIDPPPDGPPSDSTKAANDLTTNTGRRTIQAKGLTVSVGGGRLIAVGQRPAEAVDDEVLIEHASGTRIHIDSGGAITVESSAGITLDGDVEVTGDATFRGNVDVG